jgi:hypothetical protein
MIQSGESWSNRWVAIELLHNKLDEVGLFALKALTCLEIYQQAGFRATVILVTSTFICVSITEGFFTQE